LWIPADDNVGQRQQATQASCKHSSKERWKKHHQDEERSYQSVWTPLQHFGSAPD
ncbi:unnamed protein product, partial [Clavelina lepadiformis]